MTEQHVETSIPPSIFTNEEQTRQEKLEEEEHDKCLKTFKIWEDALKLHSKITKYFHPLEEDNIESMDKVIRLEIINLPKNN